jgi:cytochrome b
MPAASSAPSAPSMQKVWDAPLRCVHWALVLLICFSWWTADSGRMDWHRYSGYAVLTLLLFRIYWGFAGSTTARFSHFLRGPRNILAYFRQTLAGAAPRHAGHNPLGALSVIALLLVLLAQTLSGLFTIDTDGMVSGPLSLWVSYRTGRDIGDLHSLSFDLLMILVILHIAAIIVYAVFKRQNLTAAMLHGNAPLPPGATREHRHAGWGRALPGLIVAGLLVYAITQRFFIS